MSVYVRMGLYVCVCVQEAVLQDSSSVFTLSSQSIFKTKFCFSTEDWLLIVCFFLG